MDLFKIAARIVGGFGDGFGPNDPNATSAKFDPHDLGRDDEYDAQYLDALLSGLAPEPGIIPKSWPFSELARQAYPYYAGHIDWKSIGDPTEIEKKIIDIYLSGFKDQLEVGLSKLKDGPYSMYNFNDVFSGWYLEIVYGRDFGLGPGQGSDELFVALYFDQDYNPVYKSKPMKLTEEIWNVFSIDEATEAFRAYMEKYAEFVSNLGK